MSRFVAIIPAGLQVTGESDCLADLGGRPVLFYSLAAAREEPVDRIVVVTARRQVASLAVAEGVEVIRVPARLAHPEVAWEKAAAHALNQLAATGYAPDNVVLMAPELPLRRPGRVTAACALLGRESADSLFSCTRETPLFWRHSPGGLVPFYDPQHRPNCVRSATDQAWHRENGSLYVCRRDGLLRHGNRLFGKIALLEMDPEESVRASSGTGLTICCALLGQIRPDLVADSGSLAEARGASGAFADHGAASSATGERRTPGSPATSGRSGRSGNSFLSVAPSRILRK